MSSTVPDGGGSVATPTGSAAGQREAIRERRAAWFVIAAGLVTLLLAGA